jgi:hypothetical protein
MKFRRRRLRWLRAKAWRITRTQWLMSFPLLALIVAGAAALGAFDARPQPAPQRVDAASYIPTPIVFSTPVGFIPTQELVVTFILVSRPEEAAALDAFENGLIWREVLQYGTFEVLLVRNEVEETDAMKRIADATVRGKREGYQVQVEDRREQN